jgi:death-on-curing protein
VTEYILPDDVDDLVERKGWHYRERGHMVSALGSPLPVFDEEVYPGLHLKAAVLLTGLNHNHPLIDGNKRLSWFVVTAFYEINGYDLYTSASEGDRFMRLIAGDEPPPLEDVRAWLEERARSFEG